MYIWAVRRSGQNPPIEYDCCYDDDDNYSFIYFYYYYCYYCYYR